MFLACMFDEKPLRAVLDMTSIARNRQKIKTALPPDPSDLLGNSDDEIHLQPAEPWQRQQSFKEN